MTKEIDTFTSNHNETICPYCGHEQENEAESLTWHEDESDEITCYECNKTYIQTLTYVQYSRESTTMEEHLEFEIEQIENRIKRHSSEERHKPFIIEWEKQKTELLKELEELKND